MKKSFLVMVLMTVFAVICFAGKHSFEAARSGNLANAGQSLITGSAVFTSPPDFQRLFVCTATANWRNSNGTMGWATMTVRCSSCTSQQAACDAAYAIVRILVPKK